MFERRQKIRAESATLAFETNEVIPFQKLRKERLRQVLCVFFGMALPADIGVEREPVRATKLFQRGPGLRLVWPAGGQHDRPMRGGEDVAWHARGLGRFGGQSDIVTAEGVYVGGFITNFTSR
jgi:hypothetical protein